MKTHYEMITENYGLIPLFEQWEKGESREGISFNRFVEKGDFQNTIPLDLKREESTLLAHMIYHAFSLHLCGGRTYELSAGLAPMLLNTKIDVDCEIIKSPFNEIQVILPPNTIKVYNKDTGEHDGYCMYINTLEEEGEKIIRVMICGKPNKNSNGEMDDAIFYFRINLTSGKISESIKTNMEKWRESDLYGIFGQDRAEEDLPMVFQLAINILLYITSSENDVRLKRSEYLDMLKRRELIKSTAKRNKFDKLLGRTSKRDCYVIGSSIVIDKDHHNLYGETSGNRHRIRYPVGGHWRMQACGEKHSERRHTWIKPHFRGEELAQLIKNRAILK